MTIAARRLQRPRLALAGAAARLKRHLLATTLLAGIATLTPGAEAYAQSAPAGQAAPRTPICYG